jgi:SAM-dependent methyltransferase
VSGERVTRNPATVAGSFERSAARYRQHARVQREMAAWLAEWLPAERSGRALEIGAGPGVFTEHLVPWSGTLVASDFSPGMCNAGREAVPDAIWSVMSAEALEGSGWNWIFCSSMLQWTTRPATILARWRERLARGGRILAGLFVEDTLPELRAVTGVDGPVQWRSADTWRADIAAAGLQLRRDDLQRRSFTYASALDLWRSLHGVGAAPVRRTSPGQLRSWLKAYDARCAAPGGVTATWTFYRFEAAREA